MEEIEVMKGRIAHLTKMLGRVLAKLEDLDDDDDDDDDDGDDDDR